MRGRLELCFYVEMIFLIKHFLLLLHLNLKAQQMPFPPQLLDSRCEDFNSHLLTFRQLKSLFLYDISKTWRESSS